MNDFFFFPEFQAMQQSGDTAFTFQTATATSEEEVSHIMVSTAAAIATTTDVAEATLGTETTIVEIPVVDKRTTFLHTLSTENVTKTWLLMKRSLHKYRLGNWFQASISRTNNVSQLLVYVHFPFVLANFFVVLASC